ncbi:MAG: hypothetical protein JWO87_2391, partial [Phycisphaerales bacterium]|nr:hypothetical protein [Phycisphaerales bacterium]
MATATVIPASGKITAIREGLVIF